ncbi:MAG: class A sortase [Tetragenococcus koreensis]|nr:class A sortase [Tetragenococcus koreensis]
MKKFIYSLLVLVLLTTGLLLVFNKQVSYYLVDQTSESYQVSNVTKKEIKANKQKEATFNFAQVEPISSEAIAKEQLSNQKTELPVIAGVAVPSVDINLPIFKGLSNENLLYGAGTLTESQKMGEKNYALASHRMNDPQLLFTPLERVSLGDKIYLTDLTDVYIYQTTVKKRVEATETAVLEEQPQSPLVTLITCGEMGGVTRIVVQGELIETKPIQETTVFTAEENN